MVRDYIYIEDGVHAYLHLAEQMLERGLEGHAFNFSTETPFSVLDITDKILKIMGSKLEPTVLNQAKHEIPEQYLSAKKAKEMLGWKPLFGIDDGLERTVEWYRQYFDQKRSDAQEFKANRNEMQGLRQSFI